MNSERSGGWADPVLAATTVILAAWWSATTEFPREDLHIYAGALAELRDEGHLYDFANPNGGGFTYPPFAALLLWFPVQAGTSWPRGWDFLTLSAVVLGSFLLLRSGRVAEPGVPRARMVLFPIMLAVLSQPSRDALYFGQVSAVIALLGLAPAMLRTLPGATSAGVGVAAAVKLTPGFLWPVWFAARQWRTLAMSVAAFAVCTLGALVVLPGATRTYWTDRLLDSGRVGDLGSLGNNSLWGVLIRAGVPASIVPLAVVGLCAVLLIAIARRRDLLDPGDLALLGYVGSLLASPISWTHHAVFIVPIICVLAGRSHGLGRALCWIALVVWVLPLYSIAKNLPEWMAIALVGVRPLSLVVLLLIVLHLRRVFAQGRVRAA